MAIKNVRMKNLQQIAHGILFAFFSIAISGCSEISDFEIVAPPPAVQISPLTNFDFGMITEGNMASPLEILITNIGTTRLDVSSIALSDATNFQLNTMTGTKPCGTLSPVLLKGESCTIEIAFQAVQTGTLTATIDITSNDPNSPKQLTLTGTSEPVDISLNVTINQVELAACPQVTAFVSVTDQGNFPIEGLLAADFTITEDSTPVGIPTDSSFVGEVTEPISIALVMDNSSSMQDIDIAEMDKAAIKIIEQLSPLDEAEIIKFDRLVYLEQAFTSDKALLIAAINTVRDSSGTALYDAVQDAVDHTANQISNRKAVIVITDGNDNDSTASLNGIIANAETKGIPVFVVALGNNINISALQMIAAGTSGEFYEADVAQNFRTILQQQVSEVLFTDQYILSYDSSSTGGSVVNLTIDATMLGGFTGGDSRQIMLCP